MRRVGGLWNTLVSFENLHEAARRAALGKRKRSDVAAFLLEGELELVRLRQELESGTYRPGPYRQFRVEDPKPRLISAAPFRDRVVHHVLTQVLEPVFEPRFSKDSFACRKGFGTHRALARAKEAAGRFPYVLKCDIRKYFPSIDHRLLEELLARAVKCRPTLDLASRVIEGSNPQEEMIQYFPGDDLFTPYKRRRGLPLGNQTSQFFANVYLNPLGQMVNRDLQPGSYIRYVDDFLLFADSKEALGGMASRIEHCLNGLRLCLHANKSRVYRCATESRFWVGEFFLNTAGRCGRMSNAFGAGCGKCRRDSARGRSAGNRFGREFTRGLVRRSTGIPGSCASSCLVSSRS